MMGESHPRMSLLGIHSLLFLDSRFRGNDRLSVILKCVFLHTPLGISSLNLFVAEQTFLLVFFLIRLMRMRRKEGGPSSLADTLLRKTEGSATF